ncbi:MAG TPA: hypothetical protein VK831_07655 [Candidatus Deferrimicrobiaceae bacterium]|nr:hypothetical protein [Candidatus Deferrimicrobiaceae bacterium]
MQIPPETRYVATAEGAIAARVLGAAAPSQVWVTGTVREQVIGSGIEFESRGERPLKGVPGTWHLHEVRSVG